ncbi:tRNA-modifying protein YgfZ [Mariprofundus micogutta]|uniref:tRNA-modifying protein YgfZ n=1 Tax=Mariprofundus micogutta TaxID=1921010 RepID=A0A1L8CQ25_9PROT|nr:folate-binding protein YgfZ [Mariprofundus micogutta]GAV20983.1 tRNA-modifying protein YgfZ [Mariprofundus micogutta]
MNLDLPRLSPQTAEQLLNSMTISVRTRWAVLKASGPTAREYLQGQLTQDMEKITAEQGIHSCLLTPQGKAVSELYILEGHDNELIMLVPASHAETTVARLRQFALGHQLRIGLVKTLSICSVQGAHAHTLLNDFGLDEPGERWLSSSRKAGEDTFAVVMPEKPHGFWIISSPDQIHAILQKHEQVAEQEMEAMRIIRGFPDFGVEWDESLHPLNANLIEFDGVSFKKGCYVGQEITARMNWRGGIKKKLYRVSIAGRPDTLPCPVHTTAKIGELKSAAIDHEGNCCGIALLPIEVAESTVQLTLDNGVTVETLEACHA